LVYFKPVSKKKQFFQKVHLGFRLGQDLILSKFLEVETELNNKKEELKTHNRARKKLEITRCKREIGILNYKRILLRNFADFIAWQFFRRQYYVARRFHSGSKVRPGILSSNIESVKLVVKQLHEKDENCFALISDLTSFIDVGDLLLIKDNEIVHIEVKEGEVNKQIMDLIHNFTPIKAEEFFKEATNPEKLAKHLDRTLRQIERAHKAVDLVTNEEGEDPFTGKYVKIVEAPEPLRYYYNRIIPLFEKLKTKDWAYDLIEDIVYVGIYKNAFLHIGGEVLSDVVKLNTDIDYPVFEYMSQLDIPLKEPMFYKPFGKEVLFDLMFGRITMFVAVDFNKLLELFNDLGVEANWVKVKGDRKSNSGAFLWNNQIIKVKTTQGYITLGDTFLVRLLFDNLYPSSVVELYRH
jgi:hypothetical protein